MELRREAESRELRGKRGGGRGTQGSREEGRVAGQGQMKQERAWGQSSAGNRVVGQRPT